MAFEANTTKIKIFTISMPTQIQNTNTEIFSVSDLLCSYLLYSSVVSLDKKKILVDINVQNTVLYPILIS